MKSSESIQVSFLLLLPLERPAAWAASHLILCQPAVVARALYAERAVAVADVRVTTLEAAPVPCRGEREPGQHAEGVAHERDVDVVELVAPQHRRFAHGVDDEIHAPAHDAVVGRRGEGHEPRDPLVEVPIRVESPHDRLGACKVKVVQPRAHVVDEKV